MTRRLPIRSLLVLAGVLCALLTAGTANAQVVLDPIVTFDGLLFHYNYSVTNNTATDLSIITFGVPAIPDAVQNLAAPAGFLADFDSGLGLVSFLEGLQAFTAGQTFSGFMFDSPYQPGKSLFTALDIEGNVIEGDTKAPVSDQAQVPVPEPGSLAVLSAGLIFVSIRNRTRKIKALASRI